MLIIGAMFDFSDLGIWISDLSFRSMDFGFEFSLSDFGFYDLGFRVAKLDVVG